jgi:hypothetical protein
MQRRGDHQISTEKLRSESGRDQDRSRQRNGNSQALTDAARRREEIDAAALAARIEGAAIGYLSARLRTD